MKKSNSPSHLTISLIAIGLSFVIASIVLILTGIDPLKFFTSLIRTITGVDVVGGRFNPRYIGEFIQISLPIILTGMSVGFAFRTGLFNIGAEGQLMMGSLGAITVGVLFDLPPFIHLPLAILCAALLGGLWGSIPGLLKAKFGIHEVVITIMLNYVAMYFCAFALKLLPGSDNQKTRPLADSVLLQSDFLRSLTNNSRLHWGFIIVIICLILYRFVIDKTVFGYELRSVGFNRHAAEYAGMKVKNRIIMSMIIAGVFAGLGGAVLSLGTYNYGRVLGGFENYGFDGIAVALLGGNTAIGILLSGLLFGALNSSQALMQSQGIPLEIAIIVSGLIILFVAMQEGFKRLLIRFRERKEEAKDGSH